MNRSSAVSDHPGPPSALRDRVLALAAKLFAERGFSATSMREVAEAVGCTKPALYYHFDSKQALFLEVIRHETARIEQLLSQNISADDSVRRRMVRAMSAYFEFATSEPHALILLMRAELHRESEQPEFDFHASRRMLMEMVMNLLQEGVAAGEIRSDIQLEDALAVLAGTVDHCVMRWLLEDIAIPEGYAERVLALLFGGLSP